ncbi:MAG: peptidoglycan editing factor PgeF [Betaproteobacteria bacterium]|nr:MAG: peptidoglycan editing factor PgeF [Betaproteobacteria bacterium]
MTLPGARGSLGARVAAAGLDWIVPDWPAPPRVCALSTTRNARAGQKFDLTRSDPQFETARSELRRWLPAEPIWLAQVHGTAICDADAVSALRSRGLPEGDGALARAPNTVCAVHSADCLPVLFTDAQGSVVAAAHAGWRGLAAGVLEAALAAMRTPPANVLAWLGPAIGPQAFEVGADVLAAHCDNDPAAARCFMPHRPGKWFGDLYALARRRLTRAGVASIYGGARCTFSEPDAFYSYRRDGARAGRMATLIWIAAI